MPDSTPDFIQRQRAFAAHLRDPSRAPAPADVETRRMALYRDLVFNNLSSLLAGNFPRLQRLLPRERWAALIRGFLVHHRARTPLFPELPQEFLLYLQGSRAMHPEDPPFLLELAHYEWIELALRFSDQEPDLACIDVNGDLLEGHPVLSPLAWCLTYRFPVHRIGADHQPTTPPESPTHLVAYRDRLDNVAFLEINAVTQRLLLGLQERPERSGRALLSRLAAELGHPDPEQLTAFGRALLDDLHARGVILGRRRTTKG